MIAWAQRTARAGPSNVASSEGDASNRVVLLDSGRVKISSFSEDGHETVLGYRGAGDVLGELAAIDGEEHLANVTVVEAGEALVVPAERFLAALEQQPVGSSREAVNKALQQLQRDGLVAAERRQLVLLDLEGLLGRASWGTTPEEQLTAVAERDPGSRAPGTGPTRQPG